MASLARGQKVKLADLTPSQQLGVGINALASNLAFDISCFGVDSADKLSDDRYFVFYNQKSSPEGAIRQMGPQGGDTETFAIDLSLLPSTVRKLVFVLTIDGAGSLSSLQSGHLRLVSAGAEVARFPFTGADFSSEKAIIAAEIYFKDVWRLAAVGQGFAGGLSALLAHFGGQEAESAPPPTAARPAAAPAPTPVPASGGAPSVNLKKIQLEKKLEKQAPHLLSLAKTAQISLEKQGLGQHAARVALCLDISGSMHGLYESGKIQQFAEKVLALGTRFDDDGAIDIFLFGAEAHDVGEMSIDNFTGFIGGMLRSYPLEGGTYYGKAIRTIRRHYFESDGPRSAPISDALPVYVMFLTDGQTFDGDETKRQLQFAAYEPIFWQFMGIGKSRKDVQAAKGGFWAKALASSFEFLETLDTMSGRYVDNANFFSVADPQALPDSELYDLLMAEYPSWVREAALERADTFLKRALPNTIPFFKPLFMTSLARGQKVKLADLTPSQQLKVGIGATATGLAFDISCFGVDSADKLSDDRYFVFYNQTSSPEGAIRQTGASGDDNETFQIDLAQLPASIRKLVFVLTIDGPGSLSQLQSGALRVVAGTGNDEVAHFAFSGRDFSTERAIIAAEIYLKDVWRLAAVGQGFGGGLKALLAHFGGEESDATPQNAVSTATQAGVLPSAQAPAPPAPSPKPITAKPVATEKPKSVSLVKGQSISLEKAAGGTLTKVIMGLGWDPIKRGTRIDLDASCLMYGAAKNLIEKVDFTHLKSNDGSVRHTGDNLTGEGEGDDEQIIVELSAVPAKVQTLVFVVNSFMGQSFSQVENAFCRLVNASNNQEIARYNLSAQGPHKVQIMAKVFRQNGVWQMTAIGAPGSGGFLKGWLPSVQEHL